jgi:RNA polymerase sigma-70 factor (ECF subfamily)
LENKSSSDINAALINRMKQGDTNAFRQMVDTYKDMALSLAYSIVKNKHLAEDIIQDVFIQVYKKMHTFKFKSRFSTWLYRIVVHTSYNELKKNKKFQTIDAIIKLPKTLISKDDLLIKENQTTFINLALNAMKTDEALVLRLFYLSEMRIEEIQTITGFSKSKVKVSLHRGRSNLEFQLKQLLGDELKDLL